MLISPITSAPLTRKPELEEHHAEVVRATLPLIGSKIDEITPVFYRTMFANHPELIRNVFNRGNQAQGAQQRALAASIATFATHLVNPELPNPVALLSRIGHKHASLGITADQYQIVHDNLFAAIVEVLGADVVTPPVAEAWDRVYWIMADVLIAFEKELYTEAGVEDGDVFRRARVVHREEDPTGVVTLTVESTDFSRPFPGHLPGRYVSVGVTLPDGARQLRQYSLVRRGTDGYLFFAVRPVPATADSPAGEVSNFLCERVREGDLIDVTIPFGDLTVRPGDDTPLVLLSAGIGVTPMLGILDELTVHNPGRRVEVLHADRSPAAQPLAAQLTAAVAALPATSLDLWFEEDAGDAHAGRLDLSGRTFPADADFHLCGSPGFLRSAREQLRTAGVEDSRVHFELFGPNDWLLDG